ncbi:DUF499 domain-containing protein [Desulfococcaceae bacterium HSG9]|nr:DUF499 domain-containing protein [Desulfococcaceae bacterium HSG9]
MKTIFDLCQPRADVIQGRIRDEEFTAELSQVINKTAAPEYAEPALFFRYTYPTRGLKTLMETVCRRLSGMGGELNSVLRLDTQYGGGKTHSLIALTHLAQGMSGVDNLSEFIDPALLPQENVRVAALSGENSDPANGLRLEEGAFARSLWGEMAFRLAGRSGFERVRESDARHIAPGTDTIIELFGNRPTLILIDEISVYLRKVSQAFPDSANQFTAFIQALIKAVTSAPKVALVCTLAIGAKDQQASDAYKAENLRAVQVFDEALKIAARKLLQIDPTEEDETVNILHRRLFETVDLNAAQNVTAAYFDIWDRNKDFLSPDAYAPEIRDQFRKGYPIHPETLNVMMEKMSSLSTFQRTRGMLRFLSRTVHYLWETRPERVYAIHPHHIDPGHTSIRGEFTTKLGQDTYAPALAADVAAVPGKDPSIAQWLDAQHYPGQPPVTSFVARTIFINTMAFGDAAQGVSAEHLRYSVCSPAIEPALAESARKAFITESLYLDDTPGASMRFRVEPNLTQIINRAMKEVDAEDLRNVLETRIRDLFGGKHGDFDLIAFPAGPYEIPDDPRRPFMAVLHYDAFMIDGAPTELPRDLVRMAVSKGQNQDLRLYQNNVIFVMADKKLTTEMKHQVCRQLALEAIKNGPHYGNLADHQQRRIQGEFTQSGASVTLAVLQCYRHLFYPSSIAVGSGEAQLGHTSIELQNTSDTPGNGQKHIKRALRDQKKLLIPGNDPDSPAFVRDQTPLKTKGWITTADLFNEYRKATKLSIIMDSGPLIQCIRMGIEQDIFIYRENEQLWGPGDPSPSIQISDNAFVHTLTNAKEQKLWPRSEPKQEKKSKSSTEFSQDKNNGDQLELKEDEKTPILPIPPIPPIPPILEAEGPLRQALVQLFEKARACNVNELVSLTIRFFEYKGAWMLQQTLSTYRDADISCKFDIEIESKGVESFKVHFAGALSKAGTVRSFMEPQLRMAEGHTFDANFQLVFKNTFATSKDKADAFIETMTRYGGAEAYIEAQAAPQKESV